MTKRIATPVAPHLNFCSRAIELVHITPSDRTPRSERRRWDHGALGNPNDREGAIDRAQQLIVLVKWRIRDVYHVPRMHSELLSHKDRHRLGKVQPKNAGPAGWIVLDIPPPEDKNTRFFGPLGGQ